MAAAKLGARTALFTLTLDGVATCPATPQLAARPKGHLVREIDALGGVMGIAADATFLQSRMLNLGKGPAVHSLRVQTDRRKYHAYMEASFRAHRKFRAEAGAGDGRLHKAWPCDGCGNTAARLLRRKGCGAVHGHFTWAGAFLWATQATTAGRTACAPPCSYAKPARFGPAAAALQKLARPRACTGAALIFQSLCARRATIPFSRFHF